MKSVRPKSMNKEKYSLKNSRMTANKNWKKGLADQSVLIHIRLKFSTRKVDIAYRVNESGWFRIKRMLINKWKWHESRKLPAQFYGEGFFDTNKSWSSICFIESYGQNYLCWKILIREFPKNPSQLFKAASHLLAYLLQRVYQKNLPQTFW